MLKKLIRRPDNLDRPRGLVDRLIVRLVPRLPAWLLPALLAGITAAVIWQVLA